MVERVYPKALILPLLMLGLLGQACSGNSPAAARSETPAPESDTPLPTGIPSRTDTPRPMATRTPTPDFAATEYIATLHSMETASIQTIVSTVQPALLAEYPSADGKWHVEVIRYECTNYSPEEVIAYEQLKLIDLSDGSEQVVADQRLNCGGLGAFGFEGLVWSPNNLYFYYSESRVGFPDGMCGDYYAPPIYKLDTRTGETMMVGGGHISPDGTKLAMWLDNEIVIWDLDGEGIVRVRPLKHNLSGGQITWSLDSQAIIYVQTESECAPDYGTTYITRLDLTDYSQTLLAEYPAPGTAVAITPVPAGTYAIMIYPPLMMNYDPMVWKDESHYESQRLMPVYFISNYLQSLNLESCVIGPQGPIGDFPLTPETVQLGRVRYHVVTFTTEMPEDSVNAYYIEDQSLPDFNYENGTAVLSVRANPSEWDRCKALAEEVLATLHAP